MDFKVTVELNSNEIGQITKLFFDKTEVSSFQHPFWPDTLSKNSKVVYFIGIENNQIQFYCRCIESRFQKLSFIKTVNCNMPYFTTNETCIEGVLFLNSYYKQKKFSEFSLQLQPLLSNDFEFIEQTIHKTNSFFYRYNKFNKSTLGINLHQSVDEIKEGFSTVLKKNIKMAINKGVYCKKIQSNEEFAAFTDIYKKMCLFKNIHLNDLELLQRIFNFILTYNAGVVLGVYNCDHILIGGTIILFHGKKAEYIIGATDPDYKKLPSSHLSIFESIVIAQNQGFEWFDMGGYAFYSTANDGYSSINEFKYNFSKSIVFYPKRMYFPLNPLFHIVYSKLYKYIN